MSVWFFETIDPEEIDRLRILLEESWIAEKECWVWSGSKNKGGYGFLGHQLVHRLSFAVFSGNFRKGSLICHHCDNPGCYNPKHLYEGNHKSNSRDASVRKRNQRVRSIYQKKPETAA
jgi:hypothetical protein